jgi:Zn-dependent M16 (insulinase) family peptidase
VTSVAAQSADNRFRLKKEEVLEGFQVINLYGDQDGTPVGAKLRHIRTGAPVYLLQIETVPQAFMWVDTPDLSNRGLPHALEHLLVGKGTKGRYLERLEALRRGKMTAVTWWDFTYYETSAETKADFFDLFHAWLDALYRPDFSDLEAEREFYHFAIKTDPNTQEKTLVEQGSVYNEMQAQQHVNDYYDAAFMQALGDQNPFSFFSGGVPDEMRDVTPQEIRAFHAKYYKIGPSTGFIFVVPPTYGLSDFLRRIGRDLEAFAGSRGAPQLEPTSEDKPKYPISPSTTTDIKIFPFPNTITTAPAEIRLAWKPRLVASHTDAKLLALFFKALADGQDSLLYKTLIDSRTRQLDLGATSVESEPFFRLSPYFPMWNVGISGTPGDRISKERVEQIRELILDKIAEIVRYPDHSEGLLAFNQQIASLANASRRTERVWSRTPPGFGSADSTWKEHLEYLELDGSFVRSISEEPVWQDVDRQLASGTNFWRSLIENSHLLDTPYATASAPSPSLWEQVEAARTERLREKTIDLMRKYGSKSSQEALTSFEKGETARGKEADDIEARTATPHFTKNPPLTADDSIRYRQFLIGTVPVVASFFDRPPTIDIALWFDLRTIPVQYYKYLSLFPRCLDSLGLKQGDQTIPYERLLRDIENNVYTLSIDHDSNLLSQRASLSIRVSVNREDFRHALRLLADITRHNYLDVSNVPRLRDLVSDLIASDDSYAAQANQDWLLSTNLLRFQNDELFLALNSPFARAHWDSRLQWLLHEPVSRENIQGLTAFSDEVLLASGTSKAELVDKLDKLHVSGLESELVHYWRRHLDSFPDDQLRPGFQQLTRDVQQDLATGPDKVVEDLKRLQTLLINRNTLRVSISSDETTFRNHRAELARFLRSIPTASLLPQQSSKGKERRITPLEQRYNLTALPHPWYIGLVNPNATTADISLRADFPGFANSDRKSLTRIMSANLLSSAAPHSFFREAYNVGLAYSSGVTTFPRYQSIVSSAIRSPDISSLIQLSNSVAANIPELRDTISVDYALSQSFPASRSSATFTQRADWLARDIWDNQPPRKLRRYSQELLKIRREPGLFSELKRTGHQSLCGILLEEDCRDTQRAERSIFLFAGPDGMLSDLEKQLNIRLLRLWPSDYWLDRPAKE